MMNSETLPLRKSRCDSQLKNLCVDKQDAIVAYSQSHSSQETSDWIAKEYHVKTSRAAVGRFLGWIRMLDNRHRHRGAIEGLATPLESDAPELTPQELQAKAQTHFAETVIHDSNVSAFNQSE